VAINAVTRGAIAAHVPKNLIEEIIHVVVKKSV
jgi:nitrogen fixation protein